MVSKKGNNTVKTPKTAKAEEVKVEGPKGGPRGGGILNKTLIEEPAAANKAENERISTPMVDSVMVSEVAKEVMKNMADVIKQAVVEGVAFAAMPTVVAVTPVPAPRKLPTVAEGTETPQANVTGLGNATAEQKAAMSQPNAADDSLASGFGTTEDPPQALAPKSILESTGKETGRVIRVAQN